MAKFIPEQHSEKTTSGIPLIKFLRIASRAILAKLTSLLAGLPASHRWPEHIALTLRGISCELPGNRRPEMPSP
jgi:hypothetical protein